VTCALRRRRASAGFKPAPTDQGPRSTFLPSPCQCRAVACRGGFQTRPYRAPTEPHLWRTERLSVPLFHRLAIFGCDRRQIRRLGDKTKDQRVAFLQEYAHPAARRLGDAGNGVTVAHERRHVHGLRRYGCCVAANTSAPFPKFVIHRGTLSHELRKQRGTSKYMILVPLFDLKFLNEFAASAVGTSNRRH
jgi:hypothetical protein